jgi:hypothetical protein
MLLESLVSCVPARPSYLPSDPTLRRASLYFYPAEGHARASLFFFGNDVGFWDAHQRLAVKLASTGVDVVGFDVRPLLRTLPEGDEDRRATVFADTIARLIAASRHELHADTLPLLVGGHSIGAELAIYTAAHASLPHLAGVLAMSPGVRGHLRVTLQDVTNSSEPTEPGSFAVADEICEVPPHVRIAVIRGDKDKYRTADSAYAAEGGTRYERWMVPLAGHSMKSLTLAWPIMERAVRSLTSGR